MRSRNLKIVAIGVVLAQTVMVGGLCYNNSHITDSNNELNLKIQSLEGDLNKLSKDNATLKSAISQLEDDKKNLEVKNGELKSSLKAITRSVSFNEDNVKQPSNATIYHLKKALKGTELYDIAPALVRAEKEYGVNAYFLLGIATLESGWGKSDRAKNHSNLTGYAVYTPASRGGRFDSREENILETARVLSKDYLTADGERYKGLSVEDVNINYCWKDGHTDPDWSRQVKYLANNFIEKTNS